ncbi:MAG: protein kinase [Labilithrix sp.]|nr:protein kinase [Labilithrix sp.]
MTRTLGAYTIARTLGAGGMATVYAARQDSAHIKRLVALKVLSATISRNRPEHATFLRQAHVATRLEHPNIVRTYDVGEVDGTAFLATELVHGASLRTCVNNPAPVPVEIAVRIVADVASALHAAHELSDPETGPVGFVHQDVSPQNVLVGYDGRVKLGDFGIGHLATLESARAVSGRPSYLSPEQVNGSDVDRRADVFALGVVFWELLTGMRLFQRETSAATYIAILREAAPFVRAINASVPAAIADAVARALEKNREARFPTAAALRKEILGARGICGIPEITEDDVARWLYDRVPPPSGPTDSEREIMSDSTKRPHVPAAPDLDLAPAPRSARPSASEPRLSGAPQSTSRAVAAAPPDLKVPTLDVFKPPASVRSVPAAPPAGASSGAPPAHRSAAPAHGIAFDVPDDEDFDMQIERNLTTSSAAPSTSSRTSMPAHGASRAPERLSGGPAAGVGLELAGRPRNRTSAARASSSASASSFGAKAAGAAVAFVVFAASAFVLVRFMHRAGGISATELLPHAFDGTSATESGAFAVGSFAIAVVLGFGGLRVTPRSWAALGSGFVTLLMALAMVTVTLASSGENPTPPDGARLVPYLLPLSVLLLAFGFVGQSSRLFAQGTVPRRVASLPLAMIGGALAFLAYEVGPFVP